MRISVVGTSGCGKTTLATALARELALPRIELDAINWQAGWRDLQTHEPEEFKRRTAEAVAPEAWVCDGNYAMVRGIVWARATHLIWLDYERPLIMWRVISRSFVRALDQKELFGGNHESFRHWLDKEHPIRWAWDTFLRRRKEYEALLTEPSNAHLAVRRLRHPGEVGELMPWLRGR